MNQFKGRPELQEWILKQLGWTKTDFFAVGENGQEVPVWTSPDGENEEPPDVTSDVGIAWQLLCQLPIYQLTKHNFYALRVYDGERGVLVTFPREEQLPLAVCMAYLEWTDGIRLSIDLWKEEES